MNDLSDNIKKVLIVFLLLFVALISYLSYFVLVKGPVIVEKPLNKRNWAKRNQVLRGTIFDRNMKPLTKSESQNVLNQKREYLGGEMFSHALGYVNPVYGITGLEYMYDSELSYDNSVKYLDLFKKSSQEETKVGHGIKVTLNYDIQKAAFDLLGDNRGVVVALNPKTGEILAMVSKPSYNPNDLEKVWKDLNSNPSKPLLNRAVSGLYAPGSIFKVVTAVSALENLKGVTERIIEDKGKLVFNANYSLSNYGGAAYGNINLKDAFVKSSNVAFGTLAIDVGNNKLKETAEKFYFNKNTPADGIIIDNSKFPTLPKAEVGNIAQSGIGQGSVLASPMQMALVASTIANNGVMMKPMLVNEILSSKGEILKTIKAITIGTVTSKENASLIREYMKEVVSSGTGKAAAVAGIDVCGKTGTADHDDIANVDEPPHSWFIGFAPYEDPTFALAVLVEDGGVGGGVAAQIASGVIKAAFKK